MLEHLSTSSDREHCSLDDTKDAIFDHDTVPLPQDGPAALFVPSIFGFTIAYEEYEKKKD